MTLFVLTAGDEEGDERDLRIEGVFSTREKAEAFREKFFGNRGCVQGVGLDIVEPDPET